MTHLATIVVDGRFCGPPGMGNGGYVAGLLAVHATGPAEVTLRHPTPLDRPLDILRQDGAIRLVDRGTILAELRPAVDWTVETWPCVDGASAHAAAEVPAIPDARHPMPHCFVCGPARAEVDGLRIRPGPLPRDPAATLASPWVPGDGLADADGFVALPFLWAALDCPGGYAVAGIEGAGGEIAGPFLLGRLAATVLRRPRPGEACVIAARAGRPDGRKHPASSALFGEDGALLAHARAVWIRLAAGTADLPGTAARG